MATLIHEDGRQETVKPAKKKFSLDEVYKHLNCDIVQIVKCRHNGKIRNMVIDEEGKLRPNAKLNPIATEMTRGFLMPGDEIVGRALVTVAGEGF